MSAIAFPRLLVIVGPSGVGKSSLLREIDSRLKVEVTPTHTTRTPRTNEQNTSLEHRFLSIEEFELHKATGQYLETLQLFGLDSWYGMPSIPQPSANSLAIIMLRAPVIRLLDKYYFEFTLYALEDDYEHARSRLESRGEPIGTRLADFDDEIVLGRNIAHRVFTNEIESLQGVVGEVISALEADFDHLEHRP